MLLDLPQRQLRDGHGDGDGDGRLLGAGLPGGSRGAPQLPGPTWMQPAKMLPVSVLCRPATFSQPLSSCSRAGAVGKAELCFSRALARAS